MPKGVRKVAKKRAPRKPRGAKLFLDDPKALFSGDVDSRREAFELAIRLNSGRTINLSELIADAQKISRYLAGLDEIGLYEMAIKAKVAPPEASLTPDPLPVPDTNHKSRFDEITM